MSHRQIVLVGACLWVLGVPASLHAQSVIDEAPTEKFRFGPLGLTPKVALRNIGIDTNPLNEAEPPERDFTATVEPGVDSILHLGRGRIVAKTSLEYVHFTETASERSLNFSQEGRVELVLNRVHPYMLGAYLRTRQRPTPEIDERVQRVTTTSGLGTAFRLGTRMRLDAEARQSRLEFGEGEHGDEEIAAALDRDVEIGTLAARFILTPLTTLVVRSEVQRDRFLMSTVRDANSFSLVPGFELKPSALISGTVGLGYRRFDAIDRSVPDYDGLVGRVDAQYIMREATMFGLRAERDLEYSVSDDQPYYVLTEATLTVTQVLGINWYLTGRIGQSRLGYRDFAFEGSTLPGGARTDRVLTRGGGFGKKLGVDVRVGVDIDHVQRRSDIESLRYSGFRFGGSISYGFNTR